MTIPVWILLGFAAWTVLSLCASVGVYRWSRILTGRSDIHEFPADKPEGSDLYRRSMRAHANCVENLPLYTAVVVIIVVSGVDSIVLDRLSILLLAARIIQTSVHIAFEQTSKVVWIRFSMFATQITCMVWMGIYLVLQISG